MKNIPRENLVARVCRFFFWNKHFIKCKMHKANSALWKRWIKNSDSNQPSREKELLRKPHHDDQSRYRGLDPEDMRSQAEVNVSRFTSSCGGHTPTRIKTEWSPVNFWRCGLVLWQFWNDVRCWRGQQGPKPLSMIFSILIFPSRKRTWFYW